MFISRSLTEGGVSFIHATKRRDRKTTLPSLISVTGKVIVRSCSCYLLQSAHFVTSVQSRVVDRWFTEKTRSWLTAPPRQVRFCDRCTDSDSRQRPACLLWQAAHQFGSDVERLTLKSSRERYYQPTVRSLRLRTTLESTQTSGRVVIDIYSFVCRHVFDFRTSYSFTGDGTNRSHMSYHTTGTGDTLLTHWR